MANGTWCLSCWWRAGDWRDGRMEPITDRIVWERADGTRWQWKREGETWRQVVVGDNRIPAKRAETNDEADV